MASRWLWNGSYSVSGIVLIVVCSAAAAGCGLFDSSKDSKSESSGGEGTLPCEKKGYPCSFSEVDPEVNERMVELTRKAQLRADEGTNWKSALEWLRNRSDVVAAEGSSTAIRFRVEGGRPAWVLFHTDAPYSPPGGRGPDETSDGSDSNTKSSPLVVGNDRDERDKKRALVLNPYPEDLGVARKQSDDSSGGQGSTVDVSLNQDIYERLKGTRGYRRSEAVKRRFGYWHMKLSDFTNWGMYDVVFLTTHGGCVDGQSDGNCNRVALATGVPLSSRYDYIGRVYQKKGASEVCKEKENVPPAVEQFNRDKRAARSKASEALQNWDMAGLDFVAVPLGCTEEPLEDILGSDYSGYLRAQKCVGEYTFGVTAPFFRRYSGDFDDMLVVIDGCKSLQGSTSDLARVFSSENSAYVGWPSTVTSAYKYSIKNLFKLTAKKGITVSTAFEKLANLSALKARDVEHWCEYRDAHKGPKLDYVPQDSGVRIREVVRLRGPGGDPIEDGDDLTKFVDGVAGDGQKDAMDLQTVVGGFDVDSNGGDNAGDFSVHIEFDGEQIGPSKNVGEKGKKVSGRLSSTGRQYRVKFDNLSLERDIDATKSHRLAAVVELPEGGESRDEADPVTFQRCWARFQAGPLSFDSIEQGATEQFGMVAEGSDGFTWSIKPTGINPAPGAGAQVEKQWSGSGTYASGISVTGQDLQLDSPTDENCNPTLGTLEVKEVIGEGKTKLVRGSVQGPVDHDACHKVKPAYEFEAEFRVPILTKQEVFDAAGSELDPYEKDWKRSCGGTK